MSLAIDRQYIHDFIDIADEKVLSIFKAIIINEENKKNAETLSSYLVELINSGIDEAEQGDLVDSEEVRKKAREICMR